MAPRSPMLRPIPSKPRLSTLFQFSSKLEDIVSLGFARSFSSSLPSPVFTGVSVACRYRNMMTSDNFVSIITCPQVKQFHHLKT